jgi:cbb3-type cytochrome oxidase maturation protein
MDVIYGLIPGMLLLGLAAVAVLFWAARTGQYDDLDGDGERILMDEDADKDPPRGGPAMDADPDDPDPGRR